MLPLIKSVHTAIINWIFPIECLNCKSEGAWICDACLEHIKIQTDFECPVCEKVITPSGRTCLPCKISSPLDGLTHTASYDDPLVSTAIHTFKYRFVWEISDVLSSLLAKVLTSSAIPLPDIIVPVPLHPRRLRWRGFNQAERLANKLSVDLAPGFPIPVEYVLKRVRYTKPQMGIKKHQQRKENIQDAFSLDPEYSVAGKRILLVDDVATTGATLFECARILKEAGAKEVFAIVIARQKTGKKT